MGNFTPISRRPAKCALKTARVQSGALRAPLCIQGDVMATFVAQREIGVKFPMRAASEEPQNTQHTPLTISHLLVVLDFVILAKDLTNSMQNKGLIAFAGHPSCYSLRNCWLLLQLQGFFQQTDLISSNRHTLSGTCVACFRGVLKPLNKNTVLLPSILKVTVSLLS